MKTKKQVGRPKLNINETDFQEEIKKYLNNKQTAIKTYQNLKIGKTSFYTILKRRGIRKN